MFRAGKHERTVSRGPAAVDISVGGASTESVLVPRVVGEKVRQQGIIWLKVEERCTPNVEGAPTAEECLRDAKGLYEHPASVIHVRGITIVATDPPPPSSFLAANFRHPCSVACQATYVRSLSSPPKGKWFDHQFQI